MRRSTTKKKTRPYVSTPSNLSETIELGSKLREDDAEAAAREVQLAADQYSKLRSIIADDIDDDTLHFLHGKSDYYYFASYYLPHHFDKGFCPGVHGVIFPMLQAAETHQTAMPTVIAGWPECGKTTSAGLLMPLHNILYGHKVWLPSGKEIDRTKRFILFVSSVDPNAQELMAPVLRELEMNDRVHEDFGNLYSSPEAWEGGQRTEQQWNRKQATTNNGIRLMARGRSSSFRGLKWRQYRPDLGITDDIEKDVEEFSQKQRGKTLTWTTAVYLNRFSRRTGNVIFLGNLSHRQSLMNKLVDHGQKSGWNVAVLKVYDIDPVTKKKVYTWPEEYGEEWEAEKREQMVGQEHMFDREFLQDTEAEDPDITISDFHRYTVEELHAILAHCDIFIALDPATSKSQRSDPSAICVLAHDKRSGQSYCLPIRFGRWDLAEQVKQYSEVVIERYHAYNNAVLELGIEAVGYQKVLKPLIEQRFKDLGFTLLPEVTEITQGRADKNYRIRRTFPDIRSGKIKFHPDDEGTRVMIEQIITIGRNSEPDEDDNADAFEMAVRLKDMYYAKEFVKNHGSVMAYVGSAAR